MRDLRRSATLVSPADLQDVSRDPDDDVILGTALSARAKVIVTRDNDLLVLAIFRGIEILDSGDFLLKHFPDFTI
jgi:predicted nucleic acid-binding protein